MVSKLTTDLAVDDPIANAGQFGPVDRRYIDDQIRAIQQAIVQSLLGGLVGTWRILDTASVRNGAPGDCVCLSPATNKADRVVIATAGTLAASGGVLGVLTGAYVRGGPAHVAMLGIIPPSITGLDAVSGDAQFVRVDPTTGRCQRVTSLGPGDVQVGRIDALGNLFIQQTAASTGGGGGGGGVTGPGTSVVNAFALWSATNGSSIKNSPYTGHPDGSVTAPTDVVVKSYADALLLNANGNVTKTHSDTPYTLAVDVAFLDVNTATPAGLLTVLLPNPTLKRCFLMTDVGGALDAFPVTLQRFGSEKINGVASNLSCNAPFGNYLIRSNGTDYIVRGSL